MAENKKRPNDFTDNYEGLSEEELNILRLSENLAKEFEKLSVYRSFIQAKSRVDLDFGLKKKIEAYKIKHIDIQMRRREGGEISPNEEREMSALYGELMRNADAKAFLVSENRILRLSGNLMRIITEDLEGLI